MPNFVRRPRGRNNPRSNGRRPNANFRNSGSGQIVSLGESGNNNNFLRNRNGNAKHCTGYMSFPRKFKDLIKELNSLFGSNIRF